MNGTCGTCWVDCESEDAPSAVELVFTHERVILQYIPSIDIAGRRWDQAIQRIRKVLPKLTEEEWEQFDEPAIVHDNGHLCGTIEWYSMDYKSADDWIIHSRLISPPLSLQAETFLATAGVSREL